jgi:hypothetical protein
MHSFCVNTAMEQSITAWDRSMMLCVLLVMRKNQMNERIKELAEQATTIVEMVGPQGYTSSYANFDREKFAELIVKECIDTVLDCTVEYTTRPQVANEIKQHFGVEE